MADTQNSAHNPVTILFLGSFLDYSASVLQVLHRSPLVKVVGVVTTPPMPAGRKQLLKKTAVHEMAEKLELPVATPNELTPHSLATTTQELGLSSPPPIMITAGYGKLLPTSWLEYPSMGALNLHFSLLPAYRGANPGEWALLRAETQSGVSVITMSPHFDTGDVIAQAKLAITSTETRETLYQKLYDLGGELLPQVVVDFVQGKLSAQPQPSLSPTPYAKKFSREDSFVTWEAVSAAMNGQKSELHLVAPLLAEALNVEAIQPADLDRATRALLGFPGLWTSIPTAKGPARMKILETSCQKNTPDHKGVTKECFLKLERVQIAGQQPAAWNSVKTILK